MQVPDMVTVDTLWWEAHQAFWAHAIHAQNGLLGAHIA